VSHVFDSVTFLCQVSKNMLFYGKGNLTPSSGQTVWSINSWGDTFGKLKICSIFCFLWHFDV